MTTTTKAYSNLAHIPWAVGLQLAGVLVMWLLGLHPAWQMFWATGLLGWAAMFARDMAKQEYTYIQEHGGLRANMPDLAGADMRTWGSHNLWETIWALVAVVLVALLATVLLLGHLL